MLATIVSFVTLLAEEAAAPLNLVPIAAAIAVFTGIGAGIGIGMATSKAVESIARQPEASGKIQTVLLLGLAFAETTAIYGAFIAIMILMN